MDIQRKPVWLRTSSNIGQKLGNVNKMLAEQDLHTVCQEAMCPNRGQCYGEGTATFLLLGPNCTRRCTFCAVQKTIPAPINIEEPELIAASIVKLQLSYCVLTMVTRDDLVDGGALHIVKTIQAIRAKMPKIPIEVLISDLSGNWDALELILKARPDVLNHNIETVKSLYSQVRPQANYERSLELITRSGLAGCITKSGLMTGLGETKEELIETLIDLRKSGCKLLTMGQYLAPSRKHIAIKRYMTPEEFDFYEVKAIELGFVAAACAPLVRSSFRAEELFKKAKANVPM